MKKYTYTHMRNELSDILDILRSGESVTITQRGKPDVVLQGLVSSQVNDNLHNEDKFVIETSKTSKRTPAFFSHQLSRDSLLQEREFIELMQSPGFKQARAIVELPGFKETRKSIKEMQKLKPNLSPEFLKALYLTKIKHAGVIKKLEDK